MAEAPARDRDQEKTPPRAALKEFATLGPLLKPYRWRYFWGFLCVVAVDGAQVALPQFMRRAVDVISTGAFSPRDVIAPAAGMTALAALVALGRFLWRYFIHGSSRRVETALREKLFKHLLTLSYDFYQKNKIGDLMARATNDINAVREAIGMGLVTLVDGTLMAGAILVVILVQDARTAGLALLPLPIITALILVFGSAVGRRFERAQAAYSALSGVIQETFSGIRVVKSFVKEWWFVKKFGAANDDYRDANMRIVTLFGFFFPFISLLSGLTGVIVLLVGGGQVIRGRMTPGSLVALFSYLQMLVWPLMGAGFMVNMIQRGAVSLRRINEVLRTEPGIVSRPDAVTPEAAPGPFLECRALSFTYPEGARALDGVSLRVEAGAMVGILGRTGSGKTTLIKALTRMIDPPVNTVFVRGVDVTRWDLGALRGVFGAAPQDSYLFSDSIKRNIAYGIDAAAEGAPGRDAAAVAQTALGESVEAAARAAALDRDLADFAAGWDTVVGERGLTLSGGQKQRVAIARALAADREALILDDSLSAVDAETERRILGALETVREERRRAGRTLTMFVVSHRVSTLARADLVLVLDKGAVAEAGPPDDLIRRGGIFAHTAALQALGEEGAAGLAAGAATPGGSGEAAGAAAAGGGSGEAAGGGGSGEPAGAAAAGGGSGEPAGAAGGGPREAAGAAGRSPREADRG